MNMREKIARAIADDVVGYPDMWRQYTSAADAALEAMREPTDDMIEAGQHYSMNGSPRERYTAMIDAARHD